MTDATAGLVRAAAGTVVSVVRELVLDAETPVAAYARIARPPFGFLLESAVGGERWARYSFLGTEPREVWRYRGREMERWTRGTGWQPAGATDDPLAHVATLVRDRDPVGPPGLPPFTGGAVVCLGYDLVRSIERLPSPPPDTLGVPDAVVMIADTVIALDNLRGRAILVASMEIPPGADAGTRAALRDAAEERLDELVARLRRPLALDPLPATAPALPAASSRYAPAAFERDVARVLEHIGRGDVFQAVLSRRLEVAGAVDAFRLYRALRALNPAPYLFHLALDDFTFLGSSPEVLVRVADGDVTVRPIAGTRPRGATAPEDDRLAAALRADEKERAEHLMLVDLGRNDVGRVAAFGSVRVTDLLALERYSHVMHLVSEVRGTLREGLDAFDALRACFPAGTVTGAPKVRAMELLDGLEPERRGPYAGAVGYVGWGARTLDTAIAIRSAVVRPDRVVVQAGAGVVADSEPARELAETEAKARAVLAAIALAKIPGCRVYSATVFRLLSTAGDQTIDLETGRTLIVGRAVTSDVPIYDPTISRKHAEISLTAAGVRVKDLGSSNGTFLNGARITEGDAGPSDVITFGKVAFRVAEVAPPSHRPAAPSSQVSADFGQRPPGATIVRQLPVSNSGGVPAIVEEKAAGASHVKVGGQSQAERHEKKLSLLLEISKELSKQQELDRLLDKVVDFTFQIMSVDRVSILLLDDRTAELVPRVSRSRMGDASAARHVPQSIARKAVQDRVAILSDNAAADDRFKGKSILIQSVRSAMCTPLMGSDQKVLGILYVDNQTAIHSFGDEDLEFLIAFGGLTAVAIENSQLSERIRREALVLSNFQRYFAPNLAEQIAQQEGAVELGGTKRPVVIFFSDIRGFTSMSETMSPDSIATLLTEYFTEMVDIVFEHGGTLDKFMGDAIMALWGAPIVHADDADRAMQCAIDQLVALEKMNAKWKEQGRPTLGIGIGINYGEVFAGNIGSNRRLEYTVIGDAVNIASRLCSSAGPNEILLSEPFYKALTRPPSVETLDPIQVKGKSRRLAVYRVKTT